MYEEFCAADEWKLALFWSLAGLDLAFWILAQAGTLWSAGMAKALMSM
jgi:hypothetical protein